MKAIQIVGLKITPEAARAISQAVDDTTRTNEEHGFKLCKSKQGVVSGETCKGKECGIREEAFHPCPEDTHEVGIFHTHTGEGNDMGAADMMTTMKGVLQNLREFRFFGWGHARGEYSSCVADAKALLCQRAICSDYHECKGLIEVLQVLLPEIDSYNKERWLLDSQTQLAESIRAKMSPEEIAAINNGVLTKEEEIIKALRPYIKDIAEVPLLELQYCGRYKDAGCQSG